MSKRRYALIGMTIGAGVGILMLGVGFAIPPSATLAGEIYEVIHYPAVQLVYIWGDVAGIHDPAAFLAFPYGVVLQWALLGLGFGWLLQRKKRAKESAREAAG